MNSLNDDIREYTTQLGKGHIQKAYKGIMDFMSELKSYLERKYPDFAASAIYFGYMDMTYFAFTPPDLRNKKLKTAIVYLHAENRLELWLAGNNRSIQANYINRLSGRDIGKYMLSKAAPGVDSIIELIIALAPDFDDAEGLKKLLESKIIEFEDEMRMILG